MLWIMGVLPLVLLVLGFPIFLILLATSAVLGLLLLVVGVGVQAAMWNLMPLWYHLPFLALLLPATLAGAALARRGKMGEPPLSPA